jgi:ABC-type multidrug transport system fused ATPase/permease subunit
MAMARAVVMTARSYKFLDTDPETYIQRSLKNLPHDRSILEISHRLSIMITVDCIPVFPESRVFEKKKKC